MCKEKMLANNDILNITASKLKVIEKTKATITDRDSTHESFRLNLQEISDQIETERKRKLSLELEKNRQNNYLSELNNQTVEKLSKNSELKKKLADMKANIGTNSYIIIS